MTSTLDLDQRLDTWAEDKLWRHLLALAVILIVAAVRWHHCVLASAPLIDESTYLEAFRAVGEGRSPYEVGTFHYTPLSAWAGAKLLGIFGEAGTLGALRGAALAGLALAVWCSSAWFGISWAWRLALSAAFVALAPAAGAGLCTGNVSFAVIGVILLALTQWPRRSVIAGALPSGLALGATVAAKPLAPLALVALFFHRGATSSSSSPSSRAPQQPAGRLAALAGGLVAGLLLLPAVSQLVAMSAQPIHPLSYARSFSLQRLLSLAGLEIGAVGVFVLAALGTTVLLRFVPLDRSQLVAVAVTASVLATPIVWNHTLVLTLPVQVMALAIAVGRWRGGSEPRSRHRFYELAFVTLGVLAIQLSEGFGAVDEFSPVAQLFFLAVPCCAPACLTGYVLVSTGVSTGAAGSFSGRRNR